MCRKGKNRCLTLADSCKWLFPFTNTDWTFASCKNPSFKTYFFLRTCLASKKVSWLGVKICNNLVFRSNLDTSHQVTYLIRPKDIKLENGLIENVTCPGRYSLPFYTGGGVCTGCMSAIYF